MRKQSGFVWLYFGAAVGVAGALWFAVVQFNSWVEDGKQAAAEAERKAVLLEVAQRDNKQLATAQVRILELEAEKAALERAHDARVAAIDKEGIDGLRKIEAERDAARSVARGYERRLRDPGTRPPGECRPDGGGGGNGEALARAGVDLGVGTAAGGELSDSAGGFLRSEADRADEVVHACNRSVVKLTACQKIIQEDRKTCG